MDYGHATNHINIIVSLNDYISRFHKIRIIIKDMTKDDYALLNVYGSNNNDIISINRVKNWTFFDY